MDNFRPVPQGSVNGAVTGTASDISINLTGNAWLLTNVGTETIFWKLGTAADSGAAVAAVDTPLAAGEHMVVAVRYSDKGLSAIAGGVGSTLYISPGTGFI